MPRFNRFHALWMSFYSAELYRDVAANWKGIGALYLLLLLAIVWIPSAVRVASGTRTFVTVVEQELARSMPTINIRGGVMSAQPPGRHVLRFQDPSGGGMAMEVVIDDTIEVVPPDVKGDVMWLTRREFALLRSRGERRTYSLGGAAELQLTPQKVIEWLEGATLWLPLICYAGGVVGALIFRIVQAFIYGWIGRIFVRQFTSPLDNRSVVRLAAVAVTPVVVLRTLIWFGPSEPAWFIRWPIAIAITLLYLRFAIRSTTPAEPVGAGHG